MTTRAEALVFLRDSRQRVPVPREAERVENFRRQNLRLKLVSPDDDLSAILKAADQLPPDPVRTP